MFRKKSLKVKLSLILIGIVLLISVSSVLLSNIFLKRFYLAKKNQTLISTFEKIDDMYAAELQGKTTESGESSSTDESLENYAIPDSGISDELYLQLDKLSQTRNLSVIIYRDMSSPIFDYMLKSNTKLLLYSSLGMNQNSKVESSNIYSDYINADKSGDAASVKTDSYEIEKVNVKRLGASYIYLAGTFKNGDHILIRASFSSITESAALSNQFFLYISLVAALIGFVVMYFVSNRFLGPITVLTNIAKRMSELDFTAKYEVKTEDEVGVLGNSMNMLSETLEQALAELKEANTELKKDLEKKEQIDAMRKEFLSNVSHELKTPITSIRVLADSLMSMEDAPVELYREFMNDISDEIDRESKIIDDLLALVRMDKTAGTELNIAQVNVNGLLELILKRLRPIAGKRNVELTFESIREVTADVDEVKLSLALNNLVENAIKYNVEGGWVRVTLDADHKFFYVKVADSGIGISEEFQEHIFERFYRVDKARSRETGGTGLGLAITKNIILMHQGAIRLTSKEGEGTTFTVRIPLTYIP